MKRYFLILLVYSSLLHGQTDPSPEQAAPPDTKKHPLSFEDIANGYNLEAALKGGYAWNDHCSLFLSGNYFYGNMGKGTDRLYQTNGQQPLTQFNGALRHFWGVRLGISLSPF